MASETIWWKRHTTPPWLSEPAAQRPYQSFRTLRRANATAAAAAKARITKLFADKVVAKYPTIFTASDATIDLKPNVVAFVISQLQGYSLLASPVDVKGVAYEEIVGSNLRGDRGEFFTPRNACRMAVTMLNPRPGQRLLDPACGTGGFLITAMNHELAHIEREERSSWADPANGSDEERLELYRARQDYLTQCVRGADLNPALVRAAKMNMVMNNDGSGGLWQANSLANPHTWEPAVAEQLALGSFDLVVTNPPFGANIVIDDEGVLEQYDLAAMWDRGPEGTWVMRRDNSGAAVLQKSQPPEILFIERCVQFLRPGVGRMAMVIPNGILNNPALGYVRHWLMTTPRCSPWSTWPASCSNPRTTPRPPWCYCGDCPPRNAPSPKLGRLSTDLHGHHQPHRPRQAQQHDLPAHRDRRGHHRHPHRNRGRD